MKVRRLVSKVLFLAMLINIASPLSMTASASAAEVKGLPETVLEFNFANNKKNEDGTYSITGKVQNGTKDVTATATGVSFKAHADRMGIATLDGAASTGITYTPATEAEDPMYALYEKYGDGTKKSNGVTITMWVKPALDTFDSPLFTYGQLHNDLDYPKDGTEPTLKLGRSFIIHGRQATEGIIVGYRDGKGSTGGQKIDKDSKIPTLFNKDEWQLVTYVEYPEVSESKRIGKLYIGKAGAMQEIAECPRLSNGTRWLRTIAHDDDENNRDDDAYYIGSLPFVNDDNQTFNGQIADVVVYDGQLTTEQMKALYKEGKRELELEETFIAQRDEANKLEQAGYTSASWSTLKAAITQANKIKVETAKTADIEKALLALFRAREGMTQVPHLTSVAIEGKEIEGFKPFRTSFTIYRDEELTAKTNITCKPAEGSKVEATKIDVPNKTVTITVKSEGTSTRANDSDARETVYKIRVLKKKSLQNDNFDDAAKSKGIWHIYNENDKWAHEVKEGALQIVTQNTAGDWYQSDGKDDIHNIFYQPAFGDWVSETEIQFSEVPNAGWQGMGVMITDGNDRENYLWFRFENHMTEKYPVIALRKEMDNCIDNIKAPGMKRYDGQPINHKDDKGDTIEVNEKSTIWLKVEKKGDAYTFSYKVSGYKDGAYQDYATVNAHFSNPTFALAAFNSTNDKTAPSITAKFNDVKFTSVQDTKQEEPIFKIEKDKKSTLYLAEQKYAMEGMRDDGKYGTTEHPNNLGYIESPRESAYIGVYALYNIDVAETGYYDVTPRYSCRDQKPYFTFGIEVDEKELTGWQPTTGTGEYSNWTALPAKKVYLPAGRHQFKLNIYESQRKANLYDMTFAYDADYTAYTKQQEYVDYKEALAEANKYQEADYKKDPAAWKAFEDAYLDAFMAEKSGSQTALDALKEAMNALKATEKDLESDSYKAAKESLLPYINGKYAAKDYNSNNGYSDVSWKVYEAALQSANKKLNAETEHRNPEAAAELEKCLKEIKDAESKLIANPLGDAMKALKDKIKEVEASKANYEKDAWEGLEEGVLKGAKDTLSKAETSPSTAKKENVENAKDALQAEVVEIAYNALKTTVNDAKGAHDAGENAYLLGWSEFDKAYKAAVEVTETNYTNYTESELFKRKDDLVKAQGNLATNDDWTGAIDAFEKAYNKAELIYGADANGTSYTTTTWDVFAKAYIAAGEVKGKFADSEEGTNPTMGELVAATEALVNATNGLQKVDDVLKDLIKHINDNYLTEAEKVKYASPSIDNLSEAVDEAKKIVSSTDKTEKEKHIAKLNQLVDSLVTMEEYGNYKAIYDALNALCDVIDKDTTEYTQDDNWTIFQELYASAKKLISDVPTIIVGENQENRPNYTAIDKAAFTATTTKLTDAKGKLIAQEKTTAIKELEEAIQNAKTRYQQEYFTETSWESFAKELENAENLLESAKANPQNVNVSQVDQQITALEEAGEQLISNALQYDYDRLKALVATEYQETSYIAESWTVYETAKEAAVSALEAVCDEEGKLKPDVSIGEMTRKDLTTTYNNLQDAIDRLATTAQKEAYLALEQEVKKHESFKETDYVSGTDLDTFKGALQTARNLVNSAKITGQDGDVDVNYAEVNVENWKAAKVAVEGAVTKLVMSAQKAAYDDLKAVYDIYSPYNPYDPSCYNEEKSKEYVEDAHKSAFVKVIKAAQDLLDSVAKSVGADGKVTVDYAQVKKDELGTWTTTKEAIAPAFGKMRTKLQQEIEEAKKELADAVEKAENQIGNNKGDYTDESWKNYQDALDAAKNPPAGATKEEIKDLQDALQEAIDNLKTNAQAKLEADFAAAKAGLQAAVNAAKVKIDAGQQAGNYTNASWTVFADAYIKATGGLTITEATQANIDKVKALTTALTTADANLKPNAGAVDPTEEARKELADAVEKAENQIGSEQGDYTDESWKNYQDALNAAKNPPAGATKEEIKNLQDALQEAIDNLKTNAQAKLEADFAAAKAELQAAVDAAKAKIDAGQQAGNYTDASWTAFVDAYSKAVEGLTITEATQANIDVVKALTTTLATADANLESNTGVSDPIEEAKKELADTVSKIEQEVGSDQGNYTDESWKNYQDALNAAKNPPAGATAEDIKKLQEALEAAQAGLTKKPEVTETESEIMDKLGVTIEEAKQIAAYAKEYGVTRDELFATQKYITSLKTEGDLKGSSFAKIQARAQKQTTKTVKLKWNKVKGASGYLVYGNKCGKKNAFKLLKDVKGGGKTTYTHKKLKKATSYKYLVVPYKSVGKAKMTLAISKTIHTVTKGGSYGVAKSIKLNCKTKVNLKKGKTLKFKATEVKADKKIKPHRKIAYESSNKKVATVKRGKIKAVGKGKCKIYVYAQNGIYTTITVTVK